MSSVLMAGCLSLQEEPVGQTIVGLTPVVEPPRYVLLDERDAVDPVLGRLIEEIEAAAGAPATFRMPSEESFDMMGEVYRRWEAQHGRLEPPVVVRYGAWTYEVTTAV